MLNHVSKRSHRGHFKNTYELINFIIFRVLKFSTLYKDCCIFQCMGQIFCVEFQRYPLKFHTKYLTHTLKYENLRALRFKKLLDLSIFETPHQALMQAMAAQLPNEGYTYLVRHVLGQPVTWHRQISDNPAVNMTMDHPIITDLPIRQQDWYKITG